MNPLSKRPHSKNLYARRCVAQPEPKSVPRFQKELQTFHDWLHLIQMDTKFDEIGCDQKLRVRR